MLNQLPELYAGINGTRATSRSSISAPTFRRPGPPGSVFSLVQAMTRLAARRAERPARHRPDVCRTGCRTLTLRDLRVGRGEFDIRFVRSGSETSYEVLRGDPARVVRRPMTVWLPA